MNTTDLIPASYVISNYFTNGQQTENTWCPQLSSHLYFIFSSPPVQPGAGIVFPSGGSSGFYGTSFGPLI
ncbi:hypothetical protein [Nostoc sp.]